MSTMTLEKVREKLCDLQKTACIVPNVYREMIDAIDAHLAAREADAVPVAWVSPQSLRNLSGGQSTREWMWAENEEGDIPLYAAPVDKEAAAPCERVVGEGVTIEHFEGGVKFATKEFDTYIFDSNTDATSKLLRALDAHPHTGYSAVPEALRTPWYFEAPPAGSIFTYKKQPGNVAAWMLGEACRKAADHSAGDYIDRGLALLCELQQKGYGVVSLAAAPEVRG